MKTVSLIRRLSLTAMVMAIAMVAIFGTPQKALAVGGTAGNVTATIVDANGVGVADVQVQAQAAAGPYVAKTNDKGVVRFMGLPSDTYTLTFSKPGFATQTIEAVPIEGDGSINLGKIALPPATVSLK